MLAPTGGRFTSETVLRFVDVAADALGAAREEIDALNVFPVPDGDTGTNLFLTVSAARDAMRDADDELGAALTAMARGALLGARGNSGVILSQMLGALAGRIMRATAEEPTARVVADALREATDASYAAVGEPVEGTMLTVARAAADAALAAAEPPRARARDVFTAAAAAARDALARTPDQLQALRDAGVVDAGGRGLCVVLDAAETVLTGRRPPPGPATARGRTIPVPAASDELGPDGPAYEVMYLLDADDDRVPALREALAPLGDSLVVVGGQGLWNVHVHVDDVGAALEAGIEAGRPHRVRVTHFAEQAAAHSRTEARSGRRIVAVAAGPGLASLFAEAGAEVVQGGPGRRPSTQQVLDAILATGRGRGDRAPQRRGLRPGRAGRRPYGRGRRRRPGRGDPDPGPGAGPRRARRPRARTQLRPGRPRDDRDRPPRPSRRRHRRGAGGDHHGRPLPARRRAGRGRG